MRGREEDRVAVQLVFFCAGAYGGGGGGGAAELADLCNVSQGKATVKTRCQ